MLHSSDCLSLTHIPFWTSYIWHELSDSLLGTVKAREGADCAQCTNKVDVGDEWLCCSDCSEPQITDADARVGYCQMGASLGSQFKPQGELFSSFWRGFFNLILQLLMWLFWVEAKMVHSTKSPAWQQCPGIFKSLPWKMPC